MDLDARLARLTSYEELVRRWKQLRGTQDLSVREVACVGSARTLLVAEVGDVSLPCVAIAAGIHGDEPAAPWALLNIVEGGLLDPAFSYRIWPSINPTGFAANTRANSDGADINRSFTGAGGTPESKAIITANRDRRFAASLDLHEDLEASGFYCYEPERENEDLIGGQLVAALDEAGLPVQELTPQFDLGYPQDADHLRRLERGRAIVDLVQELAYYKGLPFSLYMAKRAARRVLTLESPATRPWNARLSIYRIAVVAALGALAKVSLQHATN